MSQRNNAWNCNISTVASDNMIVMSNSGYSLMLAIVCQVSTLLITEIYFLDFLKSEVSCFLSHSNKGTNTGNTIIVLREAKLESSPVLKEQIFSHKYRSKSTMSFHYSTDFPHKHLIINRNSSVQIVKISRTLGWCLGTDIPVSFNVTYFDGTNMILSFSWKTETDSEKYFDNNCESQLLRHMGFDNRYLQYKINDLIVCISTVWSIYTIV